MSDMIVIDRSKIEELIKNMEQFSSDYVDGVNDTCVAFLQQSIPLEDVIKPLLSEIAKEAVVVTLNCSVVVDDEIKTNFNYVKVCNGMNIQSILNKLKQ